MANYDYVWVGPGESSDDTLDRYSWSLITNWSPSGGGVPVPGAGDVVLFSGPISTSAPANPLFGLPANFAFVTGSGSADGVIVRGFVDLDGAVQVGNGATNYVSAGIIVEYESTLYIGPQGHVDVAGDVGFENIYQPNFGFGVGLNVEGVLNVTGRLGVTFDTVVNVGGTLTVGTVASDGNVAAGEESIHVSVGNGGSFIDNGAFGSGDLTVTNGTAAIGGALSNASVTALDYGLATVASVTAGSTANFIVQGVNSGIGLGAAATAGQFTLAAAVTAKSMTITASLIVVDNTVSVSGSLTLGGETNLNGSLQIQAGGAVDFTNIVHASTANVEFVGADTGVTLSGNAFLTTGFAPVFQGFAAGDSVTLSGFSGLSIAQEVSVVGGDLAVTVEGELDGVPETYTLTFEGVNFGEIAASDDQLTFDTSPLPTTSYAWTGLDKTGDWADPGNWADGQGGGAVTTAPGASDYVTIAGGQAGATVLTAGAARALTLSGRVSLQGGVKTDLASLAAGTSLSVNGGGSLTVANDLAGAVNTTLTVQNGALKVGKAISVAAGDTVIVANGQITASAILAAGSATTTAASYTIGPQASLVVNGPMTSLGDRITLNRGSLQTGAATLGGDTISAEDDSTVRLSGIVSKPGTDRFSVDATSSFEIGNNNSAGAGSFQLDSGQVLNDGGSITAISLVNNGEIDIRTGLTLTGALSGAGKEELFGGTLKLIGAAATGTTVDFYAGTLAVDASALSASAAFAPTLQQFNADDVIELDGVNAASVTYDAASGALTAYDSGGAAVATFSAPSANLAGKTLTSASIAGGSLIFASTGGDTSSAPPGAGGGSFVWTGASGSWDNAANWKSVGSVVGTLPGDDDVATITGHGSPYVVTGAGNFGLLGLDDDVVLAGAFSANASAYGLLVGANAHLVVAGGAVVQDAARLILHNASVIDVSGTLDAGATTFGQDDVITVSSGAQFVAASIAYANPAGDPDAVFSVADGGLLRLGLPLLLAAAPATLPGQFILEAGQTLTGGGAVTASQITINGTLDVGTSDAQTLTGLLTGFGAVEIGAGATLTVAGPTDPNATLTIDFAGSNGKLVLTPAALAQSATVFAPHVSNFASGDVIDLQGLYDDSLQSESFDGTNTTLTVAGLENGAAATVQITFAGQANGIFPLVSDGAGGVEIGAARPGFLWQGGASDDDWANAGNWLTGPGQTASAAPGALDDATINSGAGGFTTVGGVGAALTLTLGGYVVFQGAKVTASALTTVPGAGLNVSNQGALNVTGLATLADDQIQASSGGVIELTSLANPLDLGGALDNHFQVDANSSFEIGAAGTAAKGAFVVDAGATLSGGGDVQAPAIVIDGVLEVQTGDFENLSGAVRGSGKILVDYSANLQLSGPQAGASGPTIELRGQNSLNAAASVFAQGAPSPVIAGFVGPNAIDAFGDTLNLLGLSGGTIVSQDASGGDTILVVQGLANGVALTDQITFLGANLAGTFSVQDNGTTTALKTSVVACFARGARIATARGEIAVERLQVGDLALTAAGALRPVQWIGRRALDLTRHANPEAAKPVRVAAGAFGEGLPRRDLWLSPGHNVVGEDCLMPVSALVNGVSVRQFDVARVEYWHVELDAHDILLAEGLPVESYLDTGNRAGFENGGAFVEAHPDFSPKHWAQTCLPLVSEGAAVERTRARLLARLAERGCAITPEADPHILVDGVRVEPMRLSAIRLAFVLPEGGQDLRLMSRTFTPAHVDARSRDRRALGLCVSRLTIDGEAVALASATLDAASWHATEREDGQFARRWTRGAARLPGGARIVQIDLAETGRYWPCSDVSARSQSGEAVTTSLANDWRAVGNVVERGRADIPFPPSTPSW